MSEKKTTYRSVSLQPVPKRVNKKPVMAKTTSGRSGGSLTVREG
jgi:hypothetical protein